MEQVEFDLQAARDARDEGIGKVASSNQEFLKHARFMAKEMAAVAGEVTADDVRRNVLLYPLHPNAWGAVFKDKRFVWTGRYKQSAQVQGHGNMQRVWRLR